MQKEFSESKSGNQVIAFIPTDVDRNTLEHTPTYGHVTIKTSAVIAGTYMHFTAILLDIYNYSILFCR